MIYRLDGKLQIDRLYPSLFEEPPQFVAGDRKKPRAELQAAAKTARKPIKTQENFLTHILRIAGSPAARIQIATYGLEVTLVQQAKRIHVSIARALEQALIAIDGLAVFQHRFHSPIYTRGECKKF